MCFSTSYASDEVVYTISGGGSLEEASMKLYDFLCMFEETPDVHYDHEVEGAEKDGDSWVVRGREPDIRQKLIIQIEEGEYTGYLRSFANTPEGCHLNFRFRQVEIVGKGNVKIYGGIDFSENPQSLVISNIKFTGGELAIKGVHNKVESCSFEGYSTAVWCTDGLLNPNKCIFKNNGIALLVDTRDYFAQTNCYNNQFIENETAIKVVRANDEARYVGIAVYENGGDRRYDFSSYFVNNTCDFDISDPGTYYFDCSYYSHEDGSFTPYAVVGEGVTLYTYPRNTFTFGNGWNTVDSKGRQYGSATHIHEEIYRLPGEAGEIVKWIHEGEAEDPNHVPDIKITKPEDEPDVVVYYANTIDDNPSISKKEEGVEITASKDRVQLSTEDIEGKTSVSFSNDVLVSFDEAASKAIKSNGNEKLIMAIEEISIENLLDAQQDALKDNDIQYVLSCNIVDYKKQDQKISFFGDGQASVSIPLEVKEGNDKDAYEIIYVAEDGNIEVIGSTIKNDNITFETSHFSEYAVVYNKEKENSSDNRLQQNDQPSADQSSNNQSKQAGTKLDEKETHSNIIPAVLIGAVALVVLVLILLKKKKIK